MIKSMTAFARREGQGDWGSVIWEIRSVNHRYLEPSFKLPESLREIENAARESLRQALTRGKIECTLRYKQGVAVDAEIKINEPLTQELVKASQKISAMLDNPAALDVIKLMGWPGVMQIADVDLEGVNKQIIDVFEQALNMLNEVRLREGEEIKKLLTLRLDGIDLEVNKVKQALPQQLQAYREKLLKRLQEITIEHDSNRLEQEMVYLAQKIDIAEELDRLATHVNEVRHVLKQGGAVGRRLDFLMQELHREANTLSSKAIDAATTKSAVEIKVLIEQMREQIQNIE